MVKVVKIPLICNVVDQTGKEVDYKEVYKLLWRLQSEVRNLKNKSIQKLWEWYNFSSDYKKEHGAYPPKDACGCSGGIASFLYKELKDVSILNSGDLSCVLQATQQAFQSNVKEYLKGTKSIVSYKQDQPIDLHKTSIHIRKEGDEYLFALSLLSKAGAAETGIPGKLSFRGVVRDKSTRTILNRCLDGTYEVCGSKMTYNRRKRTWILLLSFSFETEALSLDKDKILGVDVGVVKPFMASVYGDWNRCFAEGGPNSEVEVFRRKIEARRISMLKQGKMCGDGRIGHGRKTRIKPTVVLEDKIANFRSTMNHKYARAIIDFAKKNNCGIIQMEDLSGIKQTTKDRIVADQASNEDATTRTEKLPKYLANWSYFDLQEKIKQKAAEAGIKVVFIDPQYTTLRCCKCGKIHPDNNPTQATFKCHYCGFEENADYVASQNIALSGIAKLIHDELIPSDVPEVKRKKTRKVTES